MTIQEHKDSIDKLMYKRLDQYLVLEQFKYNDRCKDYILRQCVELDQEIKKHTFAISRLERV